MTALALTDVGKVYGRGAGAVMALDAVSLRVEAGEFVSLLGPSGCGKSTLLNLVAGLDTPTRGTIEVDGGRPGAEARLRHFAYMPQKDLLFPWRSVLDNACLGLEMQGVARAEARRRAARLFPTFGLTGFERRRPRTLSGGMRQRVAFLRTFLLQRPFLLLDEPFGALDAITRSQLQAWLLQVRADFGGAALLVTHDPREAVYLSDRVYVMSPRPGTIVAEVPVALPRPRPPGVATSDAFHLAEAALLEALAAAAAAPVADVGA